jgi:hypothetical protein
MYLALAELRQRMNGVHHIEPTGDETFGPSPASAPGQILHDQPSGRIAGPDDQSSGASPGRTAAVDVTRTERSRTTR